MKQKIFILGLDGMPYSLLKSNYIKTLMPNLTKLCSSENSKSMNSVYPVVSSVAWTGFATSVNSGKHGIYGFVDKNNNPFYLRVPTSRDRLVDTIWNKLSKKKKVFVINVPLTYPPEAINGKMVSCFLCPDMKKLTYPENYYKQLENMDYIIDVDASHIKSDRIALLKQIIHAMKVRFHVAFELLKNEEWDYMQLHIMETDRLMHFYYNNIGCFHDNLENDYVNSFFKRLDYYIGELISQLDEDVKVIILSDHGMCKIESEIQLNTWLKDIGFLKFDQTNANSIENYSRESLCYSLTPGRIYINLKGREERGSVEQDNYLTIRNEIKSKLLEMTYRNTTVPIMNNVMFREEIYSTEDLELAPDIIAHPKDGFDLKSTVGVDEVFTKSDLNGMHTYNDAMIAGINIDITSVEEITQVADLILKHML